MTTEPIERLVILGATGDLAGRYLFPALAGLIASGEVPAGLEVVGAARSDLDDDSFRTLVADQLDEHAGGLDAEVRRSLLEGLRYRPVDLGDPKSVGALIGDDARPVVVYLALPPSTFATTITNLAEVGLPAGSRVVIEKPIGHDLQSAQELNALVADTIGDDAVFRVDHVLALPTVTNLVALRRSSRLLDAVLTSAHVEKVDILWDETIALEGRAGYYDGAGALVDVVQNHLLQLLAVVAMEPPADGSASELHRAKTTVLESVRVPSVREAAERSVRGRYTAGTLAAPPTGSGRDVPSYVDEDGVDPTRATETFAAIALEIDAPRWAGVPFLLRTAKAMGHRHKGIVVHLRPTAASAPGDQLHIGIDGPNTMEVHVTGASPGSLVPDETLRLVGEPQAGELTAYGHLLGSILGGEDAWSVPAAEVEQSWRIVAPFVEAWSTGAVPLLDYPAGSTGPERAFRG